VVAATAPNERVLIVGDDISLDSYRDLLLLGGAADVRCARSVSAAEEVLAEGFSPTAIVLDLLLGGTGGEAFAIRLKSGSTSRRVPIIVLSDDIRALRAIGAIVDRSLLRPVGPAQILDAIRELCLAARRSHRRRRPARLKPPG
jgi:DNA-binding response OmpR family regulator